jgi:tetratricopeptide (TPR) repeat protein
LSLVLLAATLILPIAAAGGAEMDREEAARRFAQANAAFMERNYEAARDLYQQIVDAGYRNGGVSFNLGNTWFRLGNLGKSILWYERARRLLPRDPNVLQNQREAESHREKELPKVKKNSLVIFFSSIRDRLSVNEWTVAASLLFFAAGIVFSVRVFLRSAESRAILRNAGFVLLALSLWAGLNAGTRARWESKPMYVVIDPEVKVYPGLDQTEGEPRYRLGAGVIVIVQREEVRPSDTGAGDEIWTEVGYEGGPLGWCRGESLERI